MKATRRTRLFFGFTLIELLVVIAIIAILAGLLFPAIQSSLKSADVARARTDIKNIETALKAYFTEYGRWPNGTTSAAEYNYGSAPPSYSGYCGNYGLFNTLRAIVDSDPGVCGNGNNENNPRKIVFIEIPAKSLVDDGTGQNRYNFMDPWGKPYQITLDGNYNNICEGLGGISGKNVTNRTAVVWSYGPDGTANTKDDVTSW